MFQRTTRTDPGVQAAWEAVRHIDRAAECLHTVLGNGICVVPLTNQAIEVFKTLVELYEQAASETDLRANGRGRV